jgi:hypothetical protein
MSTLCLVESFADAYFAWYQYTYVCLLFRLCFLSCLTRISLACLLPSELITSVASPSSHFDSLTRLRYSRQLDKEENRRVCICFFASIVLSFASRSQIERPRTVTPVLHRIIFTRRSNYNNGCTIGQLFCRRLQPSTPTLIQFPICGNIIIFPWKLLPLNSLLCA